MGIDPASLVHALQNHDELTHELVHFSTRHRDDVFTFRGEELTGCELGERVRGDLNDGLTGPGTPYNRPLHHQRHRLHDGDGRSAPRWGSRDLGRDRPTSDASGSSDVHLLLAMFNALQPGVFALSGWDLTGMLTVDAGRGRRPDRRRRHALDQPRRARPACGVDPEAARSRGPACRAARSLYGTLPEQLADPRSFARGCAGSSTVRRRYGIATATQIDVPDGVAPRRCW